jgi:hypothetical protein
MSPLVAGPKASYLLRLVKAEDPPAENFEKNLETFRTQLLFSKREMVLGDWVRQLRQTAKVSVEPENL